MLTVRGNLQQLHLMGALITLKDMPRISSFWAPIAQSVLVV